MLQSAFTVPEAGSAQMLRVNRSAVMQQVIDVQSTPLSKGEFYEVLCLIGIAVCTWVIGTRLDLFQGMQTLALDHGLTSFVFLGFFMSFAIAVASVLKSARLRHETAGRQEAEIAARHIARRDTLTGLPNRRMLAETIAEAAIDPTGRGGLVMQIDLDRFKPVNDAYGHAAGDVVLCEVADRLRSVLPRDAVAARLGGDEFAAFVPGAFTPEAMRRLAQDLVRSLSEPISWDLTVINVGATVGLAVMPQDGADAETLLRSADIAMYRGKREGRGAFRFFEKAMDEELKDRVELEHALRSAILTGQIRPHYQPLVGLPGNRLLGFEILARWYHPVRGIIAPASFIPIAEEIGLVGELCFVLLRQACQDAKSWPAHLQLAINISPMQFKDRLLAPRILSVLRDAGIAPGRLEVEITESSLLSDLDLARETLGVLQDAGVSVALDDFGTGYSSLYHLREMRFDKIKIDRSFVQSLGDDDESTKIVSAILGLGKSLGIKTTAEGIENSANLRRLAAMGCTTGQGYLFGAPVPAAEVADLIADIVTGDGEIGQAAAA